MEITIVRQENRSFFEPLMPAEQWQFADLVLGAIEEGTACGVLAAQEAETILEIHYLYVAEEYRRKGIATRLLGELHRIGRISQMDGELCQYVDNEAMKALDACFAVNRYDRDEEESTVYVTEFKDLSEKFFCRPKTDTKADGPESYEAGAALGAGVKAVPLSAVTARTWNQFLEKLESLSNEDGTVPDLGVKYLYDQEISFLLVKRREPEGCILLEKQEEDYILSYFCILGKAVLAEMMGLFQVSYQALKKRCCPESRIYINALTEATRKMVLQMTDQKAKEVGRAVCRYYTY